MNPQTSEKTEISALKTQTTLDGIINYAVSEYSTQRILESIARALRDAAGAIVSSERGKE